MQNSSNLSSLLNKVRLVVFVIILLLTIVRIAYLMSIGMRLTGDKGTTVSAPAVAEPSVR